MRLLSASAAFVLAGCSVLAGFDDGYGPAAKDTAGDAAGTDAAADTPSTTDGSAVSPSCLGLAATCGSEKKDSCCASKVVPGGEYNRLNDSRYPATVSAFELDVYEVTVGRMQRFVEAGQGTRSTPPSPGSGAHPRVSKSGWDTRWNVNLPSNTADLESYLAGGTYPSRAERPNWPITRLDWYLAFAFCAWDGGRLPTDAEWGFAAAAGAEQRLYPWSGTEIDATYASYKCLADGDSRCSQTLDLLDVGMLPKGNGIWGHADLAGGVWEWVRDADSMPLPCLDCAAVEGSGYRIVRGGSYDSRSEMLLQNSQRLYQGVAGPSPDLGFRCARDIGPR